MNPESKRISEQFYQHSCGAVVEHGQECPFHSAIADSPPYKMAVPSPASGNASGETPNSPHDGEIQESVSLPEHTTPPFHAPTGGEGQDSPPTSIKHPGEGLGYLRNTPDGDVERLPALMPAEANELAIRQMVRDGKANLLTIGLLLVKNQDKAYWSVAGRWESWKDFLNSLGLASYSWMTRLVGISRRLRDGELSAADIEEMGLGKAAMLLPHKLTPELIAIARSAPPQDLRAELLKTTGKEPKDEKYIMVHCERCGADFRWRIK